MIVAIDGGTDYLAIYNEESRYVALTKGPASQVAKRGLLVRASAASTPGLSFAALLPDGTDAVSINGISVPTTNNVVYTRRTQPFSVAVTVNGQTSQVTSQTPPGQ